MKARLDFVADNSARYDGNRLLFLLHVALGDAKLQNARMDVAAMPLVQHPHLGMEVDEHRKNLEVDGSGRNPNSDAVQPVPPRLDGGDADPWIEGYITDSGRKVVPVKKYAVPPPSSSSSRRSINSARRCKMSRVRCD